ncbi:phosphoenolpyruvate carboxylase [Pyrococcus horikoshii]|uniref:Phosphoenolpyruvate carboxylase n=2 Tax=Pyrococcus horikoshii TaxID=53953 RepID=CAPPA_PYRHO|nr:phosphoenolpyruvate carboxylase [Pyrococcus horikoshii]O57764.2 RecName: Full=Phosphoenolpyruvate carboxylase; Short=PEPC; Short=PEPCase [Pyrococcus horikoshii OT3]HII61619.1 phosphoenolpyruvate carboxylase [Pyrococcus horikoshii]
MIPRIMSTQHPDNYSIPFFASSPILGGEDEITEAFYAFSVLGADEQMWDFEGKEVDEFVVKKLLERYPTFFKENILGEDLRLTPRVPNPSVEKAEAKLLLETLQGITRAADYARVFYLDNIAPIFEVILPMTTSLAEMLRVHELYRKIVSLSGEVIYDVTVKEWIGEFYPKEINVIPLFETKVALLKSGRIIREYIGRKRPEYLRVFFARSDPAMNYGLLSAVTYVKKALEQVGEVEEETSTPIYPIIGVGSPPFRGGMRPENVKKVLKEYPSVQTYTIQSSFKYDHPTKDVVKAVEIVKSKKREAPDPLDIPEFIQLYEIEYQKQLKILAPYIRNIVTRIPDRRKRKLHIGLFGYSRNVGGLSLPRVIKFTASLYSIGLPPELLGLNELSDNQLDSISEYYKNLYDDLEFAMRFFSFKVAERVGLRELSEKVKEFKPDIDDEYVREAELVFRGQGDVMKLAQIRGFLG